MWDRLIKIFIYIVKSFKINWVKFIKEYMRKHAIHSIKIRKHNNFTTIGYNNWVIEKYKLIRIFGPYKKDNYKKRFKY